VLAGHKSSRQHRWYLFWRETKPPASTNVPVFTGGRLRGPPEQIPSVLAGASQVGPGGFVLAGSNYARQYGK